MQNRNGSIKMLTFFVVIIGGGLEMLRDSTRVSVTGTGKAQHDPGCGL